MDATWMLMNGPTTARGVDPLYAGVAVPAEVLAWAERYGYHPDHPDIYLLVVPSDVAEPAAPNEIGHMVTDISPADAQRLREMVFWVVDPFARAIEQAE